MFVRVFQLEPLIHGPGHESGRRAGTESVLLDVGFGAACEVAESWIGRHSIRELRHLFWRRLNEVFGDDVNPSVTADYGRVARRTGSIQKQSHKTIAKHLATKAGTIAGTVSPRFQVVHFPKMKRTGRNALAQSLMRLPYATTSL
jgi:hypothetical protein